MNTKRWLVAAIALCGAVALVSATQVWVQISLSERAAAFAWLSLTGGQLSPVVLPVAFAVLAVALVLTLAGKVLRWVLAVTVFGLGLALAGIGSLATCDPRAGSASHLEEATGFAGEAGQMAVVQTVVTPWPVVTLGVGAALAGLGVLVMVYGGRWRAAGRRFAAAPPAVASAVAEAGTVPPTQQFLAGDGSQHETDTQEPDRIADWDAMTEGKDPSAR